MIIFARHGNTFGPGDPVVWVGRGQDLPLVASGRQQALRLADALAAAALRPAAIHAGPLQRARGFAELIAQRLALPDPVIDPRLDEIDYGAWGGLTSDQIAERFGQAALDGWNRDQRWPEGCGWQPSPAAIGQALDSVLADLDRRPGSVLAVTSNGVLRLLSRRLDGAPADAKVGTGRVCLVEGGRAVAWNQPPETVFEAWTRR